MSANVVNGPADASVYALRRPFRPVRTALRHLAATIGLALIFTLAGAFDTDRLGFAHAFALWLVIAALLIGQTAALQELLTRRAPANAQGRTLAACAAIAVGAGLFLVELALLKRTPLAAVWWGRDPLPEYLLQAGLPALLIAGLVVLLRSPAARGVVDLERLEHRAVEIIQVSARPVIAGLLPPPRLPDGAEFSDWPARPVRFVEAHDHYLEVTTDDGVAFIRGRMRDAVARLTGADGLQVHRSWWVAREAVARVKRMGRDCVLVLTDGSEIPVGRARLKELRAKGWI